MIALQGTTSSCLQEMQQGLSNHTRHTTIQMNWNGEENLQPVHLILSATWREWEPSAKRCKWSTWWLVHTKGEVLKVPWGDSYFLMVYTIQTTRWLWNLNTMRAGHSNHWANYCVFMFLWRHTMTSLTLWGLSNPKRSEIWHCHHKSLTTVSLIIMYDWPRSGDTLPTYL